MQYETGKKSNVKIDFLITKNWAISSTLMAMGEGWGGDTCPHLKFTMTCFLGISVTMKALLAVSFLDLQSISMIVVL